ncbi:hypothetical protein GCM10010505_72140 [Kitasatospora aburaviensis]
MDHEQRTGTGTSVGEALLSCLHQIAAPEMSFPAAARTGVFQVNGLVVLTTEVGDRAHGVVILK